MLTCIATGMLIRPPQQREAANGNAFATFILRVPTEGEDSVLCNVICFNRETVETVMRLKERDTVAVSGSAKLRSWERSGETKTGLAVTADRVVTAYAVAKVRKQAREAA